MIKLVNESMECLKIGKIYRMVNADEMRLYKRIREAGKLFKKELPEFEQTLANRMVSNGIIRRFKSNQEDTKGQLYFTTVGRYGHLKGGKELEEVAPPDKQSEKWIKKNKSKFKDKYGDEYKKYLYGRAWKMFNGKK